MLVTRTEDGTVTCGRDELLEAFSEEAVGGILRGCVHVNRLRAFMYLGTRPEPRAKWLHLRNRMAALVVALSSMEDAAKAIESMRCHGIPPRLTWSLPAWNELVQVSRRWRDKSGPARALRNRLVHPEGKRLVKAMRRDGDERFVLMRTVDGTAETTSYVAPDALPLLAWVGPREEEGSTGLVPNRVVNDIYAFAELFECVLFDLLDCDVDQERVRRILADHVPPEG